MRILPNSVKMNHKDNSRNSITSKRNILDSRMISPLKRTTAMAITVERDNFMKIEIIITIMASKMNLNRVS